MKRLSWLLSVGMVISCLVLTGCPPPSVSVPNVVGQTLATASATLTNAGLTTGVVTKRCSDIIKVGLVISQSPGPGQQAALGTAVNLIISSGPCNDPVPNVVGETQGAAGATLTGAGFTTGTITHQCSDTVAEGLVISQNPTAGTLEPPGTAVDLVISTGPCNDTVVPNVVGGTQDNSVTVITGAGLMPGEVTQQCSNTVAAGLVISQSPPAGTLVVPGSLVAVVLSTGPCRVAVPDVVGQTQTGAGTTLTGAGLTTGAITQQCSNTVAAGLVISQTPAAGVQAPSGSAVALVLSTGPCTVAVPDVVGQTQTGAGTTLTGAGLTTGAITQQCSDTVAAGLVITQTPAAGQQAPFGSAVALVLSTGPCTVAVPDVVGMTQTGADAAFTGVELSTGAITQQCSNAVAAGLVISQFPAAGFQAPTTTSVDIVLSTGPCNETVPNVVGQPQTDAGTTLTGAGLTTGAVTQECSDTVTAGLVISQTPAAGQQAPFGSAVALVVSTGPCNNAIVLPGDVPLEMVFVPCGSFVMGSPDTEQERTVSEGPQHSVSPNGFWMGKYELTKRQWQALMPGTPPWAGQSNVLADLDSPAVFLSWNDAQAFLTAVNNYTGRTFSLPSEAQWEYACRAGTTTRFYWGDDLTSIDINNYAWWHGNADGVGQSYAHVVGTKTPNTFGLYDMSGNAWEWVQDWYHSSYTGAPTDGSAWEIPAGSARVVRGGAWSYYGGNCRSATRLYVPPSFADATVGFRLAISTGQCDIVVPNVVGQTQAAAGLALTGATLTTGTVTQQCSDTVAAGLVISQTPAAGQPAAPASAVDLVISTGPCDTDMIPVAAGTFIMGNSGVGDDATYMGGAGSPELPAHSVSLAAYQIGKYHVTNKQYSDVLNWALAQGYLKDNTGGAWAGTGDIYAGGNLQLIVGITSPGCNIQYSAGVFSWKTRTGLPSATTYPMNTHPMVCVSWYGAVAFCNWLSQMQGLTPCYDMTTSSWPLTVAPPTPGGYRLPTEAEWERAAAWDGSKHWIYGFTSDTNTGNARCNYWSNPDPAVNPLGLIAFPYTSPVGWFNGVNVSPNGSVTTLDSLSPVGAYDMSGDVRDWCGDWFSSTYYSGGAMTNPTGPATGSNRIQRGGSWGSIFYDCRSAVRFQNTPLGTDINSGFRLVK